jgi:hypothetical protein
MVQLQAIHAKYLDSRFKNINFNQAFNKDLIVNHYVSQITFNLDSPAAKSLSMLFSKFMKSFIMFIG